MEIRSLEKNEATWDKNNRETALQDVTNNMGVKSVKPKTHPNNKNSPFAFRLGSGKGIGVFEGLTNSDPTAAFILNVGRPSIAPRLAGHQIPQMQNLQRKGTHNLKVH